VNKFTVLAFLVVATILEASGDAIVRMGLNQPSFAPRALLFLAGAALLFGYGVSLNLAPLEFRRIVGLYIAMAVSSRKRNDCFVVGSVIERLG
jgi:small multidrug resistance family-3 protein